MNTIRDPEQIRRLIDADEVVLGRNIEIAENVRIGAIGGRARRVAIGDNVYLGPGVLVLAPEFEIGDYGTIHQACRATGYAPLRIGHNFWCDQNSVLNCTDALTIGNGVGIGAYSQLWTHIKHGDTLFGCRFESTKPMTVHDDVWFVGQCLVSPIVAEARSVAMLGSTVVQDMKENRVYGGSPAKDLTDKLGGPPFVDIPVAERAEELERRLALFFAEHDAFDRDAVEVVESWSGESREGITYFNVGDRTYSKRGTELEVALMKHLLPTAKFCPSE